RSMSRACMAVIRIVGHCCGGFWLYRLVADAPSASRGVEIDMIDHWRQQIDYCQEHTDNERWSPVPDEREEKSHSIADGASPIAPCYLLDHLRMQRLINQTEAAGGVPPEPIIDKSSSEEQP